MPCFLCHLRNMAVFRVLVLDVKLPAGVILVDVNRELCPVLQ